MNSILKFNLLFIFVFALACKTTPQKSVSMHPFVQKAKELSLYSEQVNWEAVNAQFTELTKDKQSVEELKEGLQYLINSLGDQHATIRSAEDFSIVAYYTGESDHDDPRDAEFVNTVINDSSAKFSYALIDENIGYLKVVGIGPGDVKEQSDFIRQGLTDLKSKGVRQWIVDLRFNGGGNIEPMISGLAPLIGEGFIGGAVDRHGTIRTFNIEQGQFNNFGRLVCEMKHEPQIAVDEKVAVLLSRYTVSSGEMLAIAFKGRTNTKFIGEETGGYTTGNGFEPISEELVMVISQDVFMDRNKKRYDGKVGVDDLVPFQHHVAQEEDNSLKKAMEWLKE